MGSNDSGDKDCFAGLFDAPFATADQYDPPDEEIWCKKCANRLVKEYTKQKWIPIYWIKPKWTRRIAKNLGFIEISLPGCAWTVWHDPANELPKGYEIAK